MRRLLALGMGLLGVTVAGLLLDVNGTTGAAHDMRIDILTASMMVAVALYFAAVRLVLRHALPASAVWSVLAIAVLLRATLLTEPPLLSTDIYRYVWDGRVQAAGINPYLFVPADPAVAGLRDTAIFPHINRANYALTIYPPVAQLVFGAVARFGDSVHTMRLAMLAFEALGVVCALSLLRLAGLPFSRILIYAWNPLPIWSFASDGHVDAVAIGFLGLALLLRAHRRDGWAGAALASAVLVKFLPLVVAPALLRRGRFWPPAIAGVVIIVAGYALYLGAGMHVFGFLTGYSAEEGIADGGGIWLLAGLAHLVALPTWSSAAYIIVVAICMLAVALAILRQPTPLNDTYVLCRNTGALAATAMVAVSPHYHWYFAWLSLPAVIAPSRSLLWLASVPLLLIIAPIPGDRFIWPALIYIPAALLLLMDWLRRREIAPQLEKGHITCPLPSP